jgi:hypothetical protein
MNTRSTFYILGGSLLVYVVMAACGPALQRTPQSPPGSDLGFAWDLLNPTAPAHADSQSGSRLKIRYYAGSDGSKQFVTWLDSQLNQLCSFQTAADGVVRCLPSDAVGGGRFYADDACTVHLGAAGNCDTLRYAAIADSQSGCAAPGMHIYPIGKPYTGQVYNGASGCTPFTTTSGTLFFNLGAEVAPTTFVSATLQTEP